MIDNYLTEINVTSPTCIREINYFNKDNIAEKFWAGIKKIFLIKYLSCSLGPALLKNENANVEPLAFHQHHN